MDKVARRPRLAFKERVLKDMVKSEVDLKHQSLYKHLYIINANIKNVAKKAQEDKAENRRNERAKGAVKKAAQPKPYRSKSADFVIGDSKNLNGPNQRNQAKGTHLK